MGTQNIWRPDKKRISSEIVVTDAVFAVSRLLVGLTPQQLQAVRKLVDPEPIRVDARPVDSTFEEINSQLAERLTPSMSSIFGADDIHGIAEGICHDHKQTIEEMDGKGTALIVDELLKQTGFSETKS